MRRRGWEGFPRENWNICEHTGRLAGDELNLFSSQRCRIKTRVSHIQLARVLLAKGRCQGIWGTMHTLIHMLIKQKAAKWAKGDDHLESWFRALYKLHVLHSRSAMNFYYLFFLNTGTLISTSCVVTLQGRHTEQCANLQSIEKEQQIKKEIFVVKVVTAGRTGNFLHRFLTRWIRFL